MLRSPSYSSSPKRALKERTLDDINIPRTPCLTSSPVKLSSSIFDFEDTKSICRVLNKKRTKKSKKNDSQWWTLSTMASSDFDLSRLTERQQMAFMLRKSELEKEGASEEKLLEISPFRLDKAVAEKNEAPVKTTMESPKAKKRTHRLKSTKSSPLLNVISTTDLPQCHEEKSKSLNAEKLNELVKACEMIKENDRDFSSNSVKDDNIDQTEMLMKDREFRVPDCLSWLERSQIKDIAHLLSSFEHDILRNNFENISYFRDQFLIMKTRHDIERQIEGNISDPCSVFKKYGTFLFLENNQ